MVVNFSAGKDVKLFKLCNFIIKRLDTYNNI